MEKGGQDGFNPYLLSDKGYPLLPWILTPHKKGNNILFLKFYSIENTIFDGL
jgi:hypothetical protein